MWVFKRTEPDCWTVGFYTPDGSWMGESDHENSEEAGKRVNYLNGGRTEEVKSLDLSSYKEELTEVVHKVGLDDTAEIDISDNTIIISVNVKRVVEIVLSELKFLINQKFK